MNVLDLDVYIDVLYILCAICRFCNSSCASYTIFCKQNYSPDLSTTDRKTIVDKKANLLRPYP
jgi:formate hydrogenlyase subunit 6/NADH:ubiquinone oxidoreductase subunit I